MQYKSSTSYTKPISFWCIWKTDDILKLELFWEEN